MESYLVYAFLGAFLVLSLLSYSNLLLVRYFFLRFEGWDEKTYEGVTSMLLVASISFLWYAISLSFTLYNKWILQEWHTSGFNYPILLTCVHMFVKYGITRLWSVSPYGESIPVLAWKVLAGIVIPIGLCTSADIVFANIAIYYLPLSMYTTIKGANLIFTFFLGVLFQVEEFSCMLFAAIVSIAAGLAMAIFSAGAPLNTIGLLAVIISAASSSLRWVLMQLLALHDASSTSVMVTLYHFSPYSALSILPFAAGIDAPALASDHSFFGTSGGSGSSTGSSGSSGDYDSYMYTPLLTVLGLAVLGGLVSFLLIVVEVKLLRVTSSLTMTVIGQIKEMVQIVAAMIIYRDHVTTRSAVGIVLSILASFWYRYILVQRREEQEEQEATMQILQSSDLAHRGVASAFATSGSSSSNRGSSNGSRKSTTGQLQGNMSMAGIAGFSQHIGYEMVQQESEFEFGLEELEEERKRGQYVPVGAHTGDYREQEMVNLYHNNRPNDEAIDYAGNGIDNPVTALANAKDQEDEE